VSRNYEKTKTRWFESIYDSHIAFLLLTKNKTTFIQPDKILRAERLFNYYGLLDYPDYMMPVVFKTTQAKAWELESIIAKIRTIEVETKLFSQLTEEDFRREGFPDEESYIDWWDCHWKIRCRQMAQTVVFYDRLHNAEANILHFEIDEITSYGQKILEAMKMQLLRYDYDFYREVMSTQDEIKNKIVEGADKVEFLMKQTKKGIKNG